MKNIFLTFVALFLNFSYSQILEELDPPKHIKTIILKEAGAEKQLPLIELGKTLSLRFDDLNGDEADYYYRLRHCNFDWTESVLMKAEYLNGLDEQHIQTYENSYNTLQLYSHFFLTIPNENVRITKTGNYLLEVYDDNDEILFTKRFIVYQNNQASVGVKIKRSRDLNLIDTKQTVQLTISPRNGFFTNPKETVKTLIFKNNNLNDCIKTLKPQYTVGNKLMYRYDQEASFWGGNEYFNYDNKDIRGGNVSLNRTTLEDLYHNYLHVNRSRRHDVYTYNPDINGGYVVRNLNADNQNIEADYTYIHFALENFENLGNKNIYVVGQFNDYRTNDSSLLIYDETKHLYTNTSLIKQGFVNYKFVTKNKDGSLDSSQTGGNFYQTENDYTIVVYYRNLGERYDRVIGIGEGSSINISN